MKALFFLSPLRQAPLVSGTAAAVTGVKSTSPPTTNSQLRPVVAVMFVHSYDVTIVLTI